MKRASLILICALLLAPPLRLSASQPLRLSASQPVSLSASQPASLCDRGHEAVLNEDFKQALIYYEQAQQLYLTLYDASSPEIALTESFMGYAFYRQGNLTEAQQHYTRALRILSHLQGGTRHPLYLNTLNNLATAMLDLGNYRLALSQYSRLQRLTTSDTTSLFHFTILANSATAHYLLKHYALADSIWQTTLQTLHAKDEPFVELYRHTACNLAHSALEQHHYTLADSCVRLAAASFPIDQRRTLAYSYILDLQAYTEQLLQHYTAAERKMKQVIDIRRHIVGEGHADYILALNNLANLYAVQGDYQRANTYYNTEFNTRLRHVSANLLCMSERQRLLYVEKNDLVFENYLDYAFRTYQHNPSAVALAYDDVLFYKGLLLNTSNVLNEIIFNSPDTTIQHIYKQVIQAKKQLMSPTANFSDTERQRMIYHVDSLEYILNSQCKNYQNWNQLMQVRSHDVQNVLSSRTAAIEFADFPLPDNDRQYIALLLRKDSTSPILVPLCKHSDLAFVNQQFATNRIYDYTLQGAQLAQLVWEPITAYLSDIDTIYYALSGILHRINLGAIPVAEEQYVADNHVMIQTSSTRYLLNNDSCTSYTNATIFGGIRYRDSLYTSGQNEQLPFLYNTLESTFQLRNILEEGGYQTTTYTEYAATKDSLCALSGTPVHVLHIATHGFYIPNDSTSNMSPLRRRLVRCSQVPGLGLSDHMKRSGLLMAGSDAVTSDSTMMAFSRTVLTARDISLLNLNALDMVVLSACETAQGDVSADGIFGLQRAFKQAGVSTIIMTLWKVNDFVTRDMMLTFYRYWMQQMPKREAFQRAIKDIRNRYPEPEYWAAYVMLD